MKYYLAIDIGASSGRHIVGWWENGKFDTEEIYRFANFPNAEAGHLIWDMERIFGEVLCGITVAFKKYPQIESLAIDTWGVDYVLMDGEKELPPCYCYRDTRTESVIEEVHGKMPFETLYSHTGAQFQSFNTIYQLYTDMKCGRLEKASNFLMLPEYLNYRLTGVMKKEYTNASTTGLITHGAKVFDMDIIDALALPRYLFGELLHPGEIVGTLLPEIEKIVNGNTMVKLCASHDTASAFESVDSDDVSLILSSGTWSLLGLKSESAIIRDKSMTANFTNEGGVGYIRFLKNIAGLWIIGQLRKEYGLDYSETEKLARMSDYKQIFDVNDSAFTAPLKMSEEISKWFEGRGITVPTSKQDIMNTAYHSIADSYRQAVDEIEDITGKTYEKLYIIGGGAYDNYLNALTTRYTKKEVIAMPMEATAIGNLKVQMRTEEKTYELQ